jgi:transposase
LNQDSPFGAWPLRKTCLTLYGVGKPWKVDITAVMRKLIVLAKALIRDDRKWAEINP